MVPEHPPPSRGGIEAGLRGARNRGPGCYGPSPVSEANVQSNSCTELILCSHQHASRAQPGTVRFGTESASIHT